MATADPPRARRFYAHTLGLALVEQSEFASVFAAGRTQLRVVAVERVVAAPYTVLGWSVDDIAATVCQLVARGVELLRFEALDQDEHAVWSAPGGARVAWFRDPDGNVLSVTQPPA